MTNQEIFERFKGLCLMYADVCEKITKDTAEIKKTVDGLSQETVAEIDAMVDEWLDSDEGIAASKKMEELEWT